MNRKDYMGLDGFVWWIGAVEDRNDLAMLGRVKVRVFGWHTEDLQEIPTEKLPWATIMLPVNNDAHFAPKEGEIVCGFFLDGEYGQHPVVMGILPGVNNKEANYSFGFSDQRQDTSTIPRKVKSRKYKSDGTGVEVQNEEPKKNPERPGEPSSSRFTRNEDITKTLLTDRKRNLVTVPIAGGGSWREPPPAYNASYPYNHAQETESGHVFEVDDTPDWERIHVAHRTGTFHEIYPSGTKVEKVVKNNYQVIMGDDNIYVIGQCNITVDGAANIKVKGDAKIESDCTIDLNAKKDVKINAMGSVKISGAQVSVSSLAATRINGGFLLDVDAPAVIIGKSGLAVSNDFIPSPTAGGGGGGGGAAAGADAAAGAAAVATTAAGTVAASVSQLTGALGGLTNLANIPGMDMLTKLPGLQNLESLQNSLGNITDISSKLGDLNSITEKFGEISKLTEITDKIKDQLGAGFDLEQLKGQLGDIQNVSKTLDGATKFKEASDQLKKVSDATKELGNIRNLDKVLDTVNKLAEIPEVADKIPNLSKFNTIVDNLTDIKNNSTDIQTLAGSPATSKVLELSQKINDLPTDLSKIGGFKDGIAGLNGFSDNLSGLSNEISKVSDIAKDLKNFSEFKAIGGGLANLEKNMGEIKSLSTSLSGAAADVGAIKDITKGLTATEDITKFSNFETQLGPLSGALSGLKDGSSLAAGVLSAGQKCGNPSSGFIEPTPADRAAFFFDAGEKGADEWIKKQIDKGVYDKSEIKDVTTTDANTEPPKAPSRGVNECGIENDQQEFDPNMMLSKYWSLGKLSSNAIVEKQPVIPQRGLTKADIVCNLKLLAINCLDPIKEKYSNMIVTNAFRKPQGSSAGRSQHEVGQAADMQFPGLSKSEYYDIVLFIRDNVPHDQLLLEYKTTGSGLPWIHISYNKSGNRPAGTTVVKNATFNNHRLYKQGYHRLA
jgi:uncharacterized protein YcbK (DUF882 family)